MAPSFCGVSKLNGKSRAETSSPKREKNSTVLLPTAAYLLGLLIAGGKPLAGDLQLIMELNGLHLALATLHSRELQVVTGHAERGHDDGGTKRDLKCGPRHHL